MTRANSNVTIADCARHVMELAQAFDVLVEWTMDELEARALDPHVHPFGLRAIRIMPIVSLRFYAMALHELGHVLHPTGAMFGSMSAAARQYNRSITEEDWKLEALAERSAWSWAMEHALVWTDECTKIRDESYTSYRLEARKFGVTI